MLGEVRTEPTCIISRLLFHAVHFVWRWVSREGNARMGRYYGDLQYPSFAGGCGHRLCVSLCLPHRRRSTPHWLRPEFGARRMAQWKILSSTVPRGEGRTSSSFRADLPQVYNQKFVNTRCVRFSLQVLEYGPIQPFREE